MPTRTRCPARPRDGPPTRPSTRSLRAPHARPHAQNPDETAEWDVYKSGVYRFPAPGYARARARAPCVEALPPNRRYLQKRARVHTTRRHRSQAGANHSKNAAQPPAYKVPATSASNVSKNYYFNRDQRRSDLGVPQIFSSDATPALAGAAPAAAPASPPTPGQPFAWKNSPVSDYPTKYLY